MWLLLALSARAEPPTREQANAALLARVTAVHQLDAEQSAAVAAVFAGNDRIGQGNPAVTRHPMTREQCAERLEHAHIDYQSPAFEAICGAPYMAPLYDPATQRPEDARACIDRFEFPDIPCEYPVTWVRAREAAEICAAMGKRLCDAHEWEGACAGSLQPPDYRFDLAKGASPNQAVQRMRAVHNRTHEKSWAFGDHYEPGVCAAASEKSPGCNGGEWVRCGTNTYPSGAFPGCISALGVLDQHGNAAEHMNLPLRESQMASGGSATLGVTEMKGSWFIFDRYHAHEDWCRWRAPYWHGGPVMASDSHQNYHLGFRCCRDVEAR